MILWKSCTQYASKFGKLSSGHRTGKGQFSFQSQRKAMPKMFKLQHNLTHLTRQQSSAQNSPRRLQQYINWELPDLQDGFTQLSIIKQTEICPLTNTIIVSLLSNLTNLSRNPSNKPEIRELLGNSWIVEWKELKHQGRVRFTLENTGRWWNLWMSSVNADRLFDEWSSLAMQCVHSSCWREIAVCHFRLQVNHLYSLSFLGCWRE